MRPVVEILKVILLIFLGAARSLSAIICINVLHAQGLIRMNRSQQNQYSDFRHVGSFPQSSGARFQGVRPAAFRPSSILASVRPARGTSRFNFLRPIKIEHLREYLVGYDYEAASELFHGFLEGFSLHYNGPRIETECRNLKSVRDNEYVALRLVL